MKPSTSIAYASACRTRTSRSAGVPVRRFHAKAVYDAEGYARTTRPRRGVRVLRFDQREIQFSVARERRISAPIGHDLEREAVEQRRPQEVTFLAREIEALAFLPGLQPEWAARDRRREVLCRVIDRRLAGRFAEIAREDVRGDRRDTKHGVERWAERRREADREVFVGDGDASDRRAFPLW